MNELDGKKIKYTFLLPAYKIDFLYSSIRSILNQTYDNFIIYVSDDCSPYDIKSVIEKLNDNRIIYHRNEENIGAEKLVTHWNKILAECKTDYVIIASDDDLYSPYFLEEIDKLIIKYPEVDIYRARVQEIDKNDIIQRRENIYEEFNTQLEYVSSYYFTNHIQCIGNYVFKTKSLKDNGGFHSFPLAWYSDFVTSVELANKGIINTSSVLFSFRLSGQNLSSSTKSDFNISRYKLKAVLDYNSWMKMLIDNFEQNVSSPFEQNNLALIKTSHKKDFIGNVLHYIHVMSFKEVFIFLKKYKVYFNTKLDIFIFIKKWYYSKRK